jgi:Flp pilus assembly secretin CpaC
MELTDSMPHEFYATIGMTCTRKNSHKNFGKGIFSFFLPVIFFQLICLVARPALAEQPVHPPSPPVEIETIITKEIVLELKVGEKKRIQPEARVLNAAVTRPEVVEGYVSGEQEIMVVANSPGVGKIILQLASGNIVCYIVRVNVVDPQGFASELREKLKDIQNLNVEVIKEKILVEGRVLYLRDMDAIERAIGDNPSIINLTSLSSRNARILAREIERELRESGIYGVKVDVKNNRVTLVGTLASDVLVKKAEQIASTFTPNYDSVLKTGISSESK